MDTISSPWNRRWTVKPVIVPVCGTVAVTVLCAAAACGGLPSLTAPSSPTELEIRGTTLLMPGHSGRLTAWLADDGNLRQVPATWSTESDAVSITSTGGVTANRPGAAKVRARYGAHDGLQTVHVVDSVAGTWRGSITVIDCWGGHETPLGPCQGRSGIVAPLVVNVTQRATADNYDNLRATVQVFTPPARGDFVGATDSSGQVFLDGYVERPGDRLGGALKLRWMREADGLVPFMDSPRGSDTIDVQLAMGSTTLVHEVWRLSTMSR